MKSRLLFFIKYYIFWISIFLVQKILFMLFNYTESFALGISDWISILIKGLPLDLSAAAYICVIPSVVILVGFITGSKFTRIFINVYTYIIIFLVTFLAVVDMNLYSYWGFKLDISPLFYLKTPGEAMASVKISEILFLVAVLVVLYFICLLLYQKFVKPVLLKFNPGWWKSVLSGFLMILILIWPARGGIGLVPMNLSKVYFHPNRFANHSAINVLWNTIYSITERNKLLTEINFMDEEKMKNLYSEIMFQDTKENKILIKENANVLMIILESFSNKMIGALGGESDVTPGLNNICKNAVIFTNFYASGDRSDKGIVSIFSGFPAQPTTSIINYPKKAQNLPFLMDGFSEMGYDNAFYYGGDLDFANFKAYLSNNSLHKFITVDDFSEEIPRQKWGVPDEYLFSRLLADLNQQEPPFFYSCFSLSSHDPFDIPTEPVFGSDTRDNLSRSSFYYTDNALFEFFENARESEWWENTLIIILADHGSRSPGNSPNYTESNFRIPMIWTGGAILNDTTIDKIGGQTDLAATLLSQFNLEPEGFTYSKNLLDTYSPSFAFYAFNNGFGFKTDSGIVIFDNDFSVIINSEGSDSLKSLENGKAYLQHISEDFTKK